MSEYAKLLEDVRRVVREELEAHARRTQQYAIPFQPSPGPDCGCPQWKMLECLSSGCPRQTHSVRPLSGSAP